MQFPRLVALLALALLSAAIDSIAAADGQLSAIADFPADLRNQKPVSDIGQAAVYTVNEFITDAYGIDLAKKTGSDVLIRGWFKWHQAPDFAKLAPTAVSGHSLGALFGGGVTCSALYHGENKLTEAQVLDMATRGPSGELIDAWKTKGCRHGTLSNPRYLEYVLKWCRQQIDQGVDYLFMDEINAALHENEGFDDYSVADFRMYLLDKYCQAQNWTANDRRWASQFKMDLNDKALCPDGTVKSLNYREYLKRHNLLQNPSDTRANPLAIDWQNCRRQRDDRAWKSLCDQIRAYVAQKGKKIYISGNGLAKYVDLQVLGVWGLWRVTDGHVDFTRSQMPDWAATARAGKALAGKKVPVVFFHDWGFDGFPYLKVSREEKILWDRIRGAEIYASGAFYAFPVHGPMGCDAFKDGTLAAIARQTAFYQRHKSLYQDAELRSVESAKPAQDLISASLWTRGGNSPAVIVHVVNRKVEGYQLLPRENVGIDLPVSELPAKITVVSPDFAGDRTATASQTPQGLRLVLPQLEAYSVAMLEYGRGSKLPAVKITGDRLVPGKQWARPQVSQFKVDHSGNVDQPAEVFGVMQGKLHAHMANPPAFAVRVKRDGQARLDVCVGSVAMAGAKLECFLDGNVVTVVDLPDLDKKNDTGAAEYDKIVTVNIPPGQHQVSLRNTGADWLTVSWLRFSGDLLDAD